MFTTLRRGAVLVAAASAIFCDANVSALRLTGRVHQCKETREESAAWQRPRRHSPEALAKQSELYKQQISKPQQCVSTAAEEAQNQKVSQRRKQPAREDSTRPQAPAKQPPHLPAPKKSPRPAKQAAQPRQKQSASDEYDQDDELLDAPLESDDDSEDEGWSGGSEDERDGDDEEEDDDELVGFVEERATAGASSSGARRAAAREKSSKTQSSGAKRAHDTTSSTTALKKRKASKDDGCGEYNTAPRAHEVRTGYNSGEKFYDHRSHLVMEALGTVPQPKKQKPTSSSNTPGTKTGLGLNITKGKVIDRERLLAIIDGMKRDHTQSQESGAAMRDLRSATPVGAALLCSEGELEPVAVQEDEGTFSDRDINPDFVRDTMKDGFKRRDDDSVSLPSTEESGDDEVATANGLQHAANTSPEREKKYVPTATFPRGHYGPPAKDVKDMTPKELDAHNKLLSGAMNLIGGGDPADLRHQWWWHKRPPLTPKQEKERKRRSMWGYAEKHGLEHTLVH